MGIDTEGRIRGELIPGERLLWSGRPRRGIRLQKADALFIPFSLVWCGGLALAVTTAIRDGASGWFLLFFTPFALIGLYLIAGRFVLDALRRERAVYGLTERRALIVSGLLRRQVESLPLATVPFVELHAGRDGRGTISFGFPHRWSLEGEDAASAFVMINDAPRVHALIRQVRTDRNRRGVGAPHEAEAKAPRWDLPAPEAEVLVHGPKTGDWQALRLALKELVVRQELRFVSEQTHGSFGRLKRTELLVLPEGRDAIGDRSLSAILRVFATVGSRDSFASGLARPIGDLAREVFKNYHKGGGNGPPGAGRGYVRREVLPALEGRGLYARERFRRLGLFDAIRWVLTPAGATVRSDLQARLARHGGDRWGVTGELRARAGFAGDPDELDRAFAAIDAGVDRGWNAVYGD